MDTEKDGFCQKWFMTKVDFVKVDFREMDYNLRDFVGKPMKSYTKSHQSHFHPHHRINQYRRAKIYIQHPFISNISKLRHCHYDPKHSTWNSRFRRTYIFKLKIIKDYIIYTQNRPVGLSISAAEKELVETPEYQDLTKEFAKLQTRKVQPIQLLGKNKWIYILFN